MDADDFMKIQEMFKQQIGILSEDFQHKLDIVVEGHQMLSEKIDRVDATLSAKLERVEGKVDAVAADLAAHRADTEGHGAVYRVKESGEVPR